MGNNEDTGAHRATFITLVALIMGVVLMSISFAAAETTYTPTTTTICEGSECTKTLYSGVQNVYEDEQWKDIYKAKSLKESGAFEVKFLETDSEYPMTVLDYNMTSITVDLDHWSFFNEEVDIRIWKANKTKEEQYQQDVKDGNKENNGLGNSYKDRFEKVKHDKENFNVFDLGDKKVTYEVSPGDIIEFGPNSTTLILQTADSENLEDTYVRSPTPTTNYGTSDILSTSGEGLSNARKVMVKFNLSSIDNPAAVSILNSNFSLYLEDNFLDAGEQLDIGVYHLYNNYNWVETGPTWNTKPGGGNYNSTRESFNSYTDATGDGRNYWNVANMVTSQMLLGGENLSIYVFSTIGGGSPSEGDSIGFSSKEEAITSQRPKLEITYNINPSNATITYPDDGATYNTLVTHFNWSITNYTTLDTCKYSLNGASNISVTCTDYYKSITANEGSNNLIFTFNETSGATNYTEIDFTQDIPYPEVNITYPINGSITSTSINHFNWSITNGTALDNCKYSLDGAANVSATCTDNYKAFTPGDGIHNMIFTVEDDLARTNWTQNYFTQDTTAPVINVTYPFGTITNETVGHTLYFNWTASDATVGLSSCWYNYNNTNTTVTCGDQNTTFVTNIAGQRNLTFYANDTLNNIGSTVGTWDYKFLERSRTFNVTTYETTTDYYILNMSSDGTETVTASFWYDGAEYTATKNGNNVEMIFTSEVSHPFGTLGNKTFYWEVTHGATTIYSSPSGQDVQGISMGPCNATLVTPFINFTFKDEGSEAFINSTFEVYDWFYYTGDGTQNKTFDYVNLTEQESYSFCAAPNLTFHNNASITYQADGYPQRIFAQSVDLTNNTEFLELYLLSTADGQYVTFQTQDQYAQTINGATITIEKQTGGAWLAIGQDLTDSAGTVTFFLNPDDNHRITATKDGYSDNIQTIRPTQTLYTIVMTGGQQDSTQYMWEGIRYNAWPQSGTFLAANTSYDFGFNITSSVGNITRCKISITNTSFNEIGNAVGCGAFGGNVSVNLNTGDNLRFFGNYYVDLGEGYQLMKSNDVWIIDTPSAAGGNSVLFVWMDNFNNWDGFGTGNAAEFNRITFFFILLVIILGIITRVTGVETIVGITAGQSLLTLWGIITIFSLTGTFTVHGIIPNEWLSKYYVWIVTSFITWGFTIHHWRTRYT